MEDFHTSLIFLIQTSFQIHDKKYGKMAKEIRLWMSWTQKFLRGYTQKTNEGKKELDTFIQAFQTFFDAHSAELTSPIFVNTGNENWETEDKWLKDDQFHDGPGFSVKEYEKMRSSGNWDPMNNRCKGHVIYHNDNPKLYMFSIPISEIYNCALTLYKSNADDSECKVLPGRILYGLFYTIYHALPEAMYSDAKRAIMLNINEIKDFIDLNTAKETQNNIGSGVSGISKMINKLVKSAGISNGGFDIENIGKSLSNFSVSDSSIEKIGGAIGTIVNSVTSTNISTAGGLDSTIDKVASSLTDQKTKDALKDVINVGQSVYNENKGVVESAATEASSSAATEGAGMCFPDSVSCTETAFDPSMQD